MKFSSGMRKFLVILTSTALLALPTACSYKPGYLQQSQKTPIPERWRAFKINTGKLSPDELEVYKKMGPPQYVRFYRHLSLDRERVYEWIYTDPEPVRLVSFMKGKKLTYVVVDDKTTPLNESQKNTLFWTGITAGSIVAVGALYYFLFAR